MTRGAIAQLREVFAASNLRRGRRASDQARRPRGPITELGNRDRRNEYDDDSEPAPAKQPSPVHADTSGPAALR